MKNEEFLHAVACDVLCRTRFEPFDMFLFDTDFFLLFSTMSFIFTVTYGILDEKQSLRFILLYGFD